MVDPDMQALTIDNGSGLIKCGFSGDDAPRSVFPTIVGRHRNPRTMVGNDAKDCFVGDEAQAKRGFLKLKYPMERGSVTNWNEMEKIWHHTFYKELRVTPEEHPVLMTEVANNPKRNREKMTSIHFETFNIPAFYISNPSVLAVYASGRTTACVLDIGDSVTQVATVYEGYTMGKHVIKRNIGGRDITNYLHELLSKENKFESSRNGSSQDLQGKYETKLSSSEARLKKYILEIFNSEGLVCSRMKSREIDQELGTVFDGLSDFMKAEMKVIKIVPYSPGRSVELEITRDMKEKLGYVALDYCSELEKAETSSQCEHEYELPDGSKMTIGSERFKVTEVFFQPSFIGMEYEGIHELVYNAIHGTKDINIIKDFYYNILICGGSTMFEGIVERLNEEIMKLVPRNARIKVSAPAERKFSAWIGGSILSAMSTFQNMWITKVFV